MALSRGRFHDLSSPLQEEMGEVRRGYGIMEEDRIQTGDISIAHSKLDKKEKGRCCEEAQIWRPEPGATMEETGVRTLPEEETCDINASKEIRISTVRPTVSVEVCIPFGAIQQTEPQRSPNLTDGFSTDCLFHRADQAPAAATSSTRTKEKDAEERKSFAPDDMGSHQFYSRLYREAEPAAQSRRMPRIVSEEERDTARCYSQLNILHESHLSDRGQKPDANELPGDDDVFLSTSFTLLLTTPAETQRTDRRHMPDTDTESLATPSSPLPNEPDWMQWPYETQFDQNHSPRASSFFCRTAALVLSLLIFSARTCSAATQNLCEGKEAVSKGEVILDCPIATDVQQTKQSVVITYADFPTTHEEVLGCDWLKRLQGFDCLKSRCGAELIAIKSDRVLARLPEDRLHHNGSYYCQVVPAGINERFPDCHICYPADPTTTTVRAVTLSATGDPPEPDDPQNRAVVPSAAYGGLVTAVVVLSFVVFLLLLLNLGATWIVYLKFRMLRGDKRRGITFGESKLSQLMALPTTLSDCNGGSLDIGRSQKELAETLDVFNDTPLISGSMGDDIFKTSVMSSAPGQRSKV